jgi:peptidase E
MMTKFILHGGVMSPRSESNKAFYAEMSAGIDMPKVLLVYFARQITEYDYLLNRDQDNFAWANPGKDFEFTIAEPEKLHEQVAKSDVVLIAGGDTDKLFKAIRDTDIDLQEECKGKVIAGSSAGAYLISRWYYTNSGKEIRKGLGLVNVAAWAHYRADRGNEYFLEDDKIAQIEQGLRSRIDGKHVALLREQEYKVYEV